MRLSLSLLALCLGPVSLPVLAATAGSFEVAGSTLVSALMVSTLFTFSQCLSPFPNESVRCFSETKKKCTYWISQKGIMQQLKVTPHGALFGELHYAIL